MCAINISRQSVENWFLHTLNCKKMPCKSSSFCLTCLNLTTPTPLACVDATVHECWKGSSHNSSLTKWLAVRRAGAKSLPRPSQSEIHPAHLEGCLPEVALLGMIIVAKSTDGKSTTVAEAEEKSEQQGSSYFGRYSSRTAVSVYPCRFFYILWD